MREDPQTPGLLLWDESEVKRQSVQVGVMVGNITFIGAYGGFQVIGRFGRGAPGNPNIIPGPWKNPAPPPAIPVPRRVAAADIGVAGIGFV